MTWDVIYIVYETQFHSLSPDMASSSNKRKSVSSLESSRRYSVPLKDAPGSSGSNRSSRSSRRRAITSGADSVPPQAQDEYLPSLKRSRTSSSPSLRSIPEELEADVRRTPSPVDSEYRSDGRLQRLADDLGITPPSRKIYSRSTASHRKQNARKADPHEGYCLLTNTDSVVDACHLLASSTKEDEVFVIMLNYCDQFIDKVTLADESGMGMGDEVQHSPR